MGRRILPIGAPMVERSVQRGAIQLLTVAGFRAVHVPNGAHLAGDKLARIKQIAALKKDGLSVGFPDLIVFGKRQFDVGFMECKHEDGGDFPKEQQDWRDDLVALGFPWALIRKPEEAIAAVTRWGWRGSIAA
jgi:hypothetical protein